MHAVDFLLDLLMEIIIAYIIWMVARDYRRLRDSRLLFIALIMAFLLTVDVIVFAGSLAPLESQVDEVTFHSALIDATLLLVVWTYRERRKAEMSLQYQNEHLEQLVEERSQKLVEAERMAAAGSVAVMVGHDLRGPLQTIKNAVYLMEKDPDSAHELRETINESVNYAASMLEELRLKVGDTPLQIQEVNLGAIIRKAVEEASIPDSVETELHVDDGLDSVSMDPLKIRRVLDNLIRNAVQAMPDGGTLEVSAVCDGDVVFLRVRDTGTGIPEDLMPDLFKAFVTTKPQGMGLGLAYCKRAVEAHGGTIVVESKIAVGTTFTVRLSMEPK
jgi:signal transduction histidine kinase